MKHPFFIFILCTYFYFILLLPGPTLEIASDATASHARLEAFR